jgi:hypothetical protein
MKEMTVQENNANPYFNVNGLKIITCLRFTFCNMGYDRKIG